MAQPAHHQDEEWFRRGIDIALIRENLALSYEERIVQHQGMLQLIDELKQIGLENRARSTKTSKTSCP